MYSFGDILIINFPFSDAMGSKRRPVLVIKNTDDRDILVAKITSQIYSTPFDVPLIAWNQSNLISPSVIRIHKIQTLHSSLVFGKIGKLTPPDLNSVKHSLMNLVQNL